MRRFRARGIFLALFLFSAGCTSGSAPSVSPLTLEMLKNAEYHSMNFPRPVPLTEGQFVSPAPNGDDPSDYVFSLSEWVAYGDIDGDSLPDAAVLLTSWLGGSGLFFELEAVRNDNGKPQNIASAFLGDRVLIHALFIRDGEIVLQMTVHDEDDPFCCPSKDVRWVFRLRGNDLMRTTQP